MHVAKLNIDAMSSNYDYFHPLKIEVFFILMKLKKIAEKLSLKQG
jgi:hypothetical protein